MCPRIGVIAGWSLLGCLSVAFADADDLSTTSIDTRSSNAAAMTQVPPERLLQLPLTGAEIQATLRAIYAERQSHPADTGDGLEEVTVTTSADGLEEVTVTTSADGLEEVTVTAPEELLPMRDETQEIPGGVAALLWAIAHPTQSWRIFLPIPPK
jgi:hypothetical protein